MHALFNRHVQAFTQRYILFADTTYPPHLVVVSCTALISLGFVHRRSLCCRDYRDDYLESRGADDNRWVVIRWLSAELTEFYSVMGLRFMGIGAPKTSLNW